MKKTTQLALCAILIALALALSYTERMIPLQLLIPLPGIKLGLANIVTLIALYLQGPKTAFTVLVLRCIMGSFFGGGLTGLAFSLTGGLLSMTVMVLTKRLPCFSVYGVSILGAAFHNVGQIAAAMALMQTVYVASYLPYLLMVALLTGFATGCAGAGILRVLSAVPAFTFPKANR
ncbi:MAG: Gx transporter family protein [Clostridia bacterium]|nr:Gx transporter family protein [Clostridia bacterium]